VSRRTDGGEMMRLANERRALSSRIEQRFLSVFEPPVVVSRRLFVPRLPSLAALLASLHTKHTHTRTHPCSHCVFGRMFAATVDYFNDTPNVVGFEIMNEPAPSELRLLDFSTNKLYPFYKRAVQAVTGVRDGLPTCKDEGVNSLIDSACAFPDLGINTDKIMFFEVRSEPAQNPT